MRRQTGVHHAPLVLNLPWSLALDKPAKQAYKETANIYIYLSSAAALDLRYAE